MKKILLPFFVLFSFGLIAFAQEPEVASEASKNSIDWLQVIVAGGYLLGVFVLLPIVAYTNVKEKLYDPSESQEPPEPVGEMDEEARSLKSQEILAKIEEKLTPVTDDSGNELVTITKGPQARFMKYGLDYINKHLVPTDEDIKARVNELSEVYKDRTKRAYTGSNWVLACGIGFGVLGVLAGGFSFFIILHALGLGFYYLSSRTPFYTLKKRMDWFGSTGGTVGNIMTALFLGNGVKYYMKDSFGSWKRDWESEGQMALVGIIILVIVAIFLGIFVAVFGVLNSLLNYSSNFLTPFSNEKSWYEKTFLSV